MQCTHFSSLELGICAISCTDHTAYFDNGCHQRTKIYFPGSLPFSTPDLGDELQPRWCYFPLEKEVDMRFANFSLKSLEQFWSGANPWKVQYLQSCKVFDRCFDKILQDSKKSYVNTKTHSCSKYINSHDGTEKTFSCTTDLIESSKSIEDDCNSSCNGSDTKHKAQRHNQGKRKASRHENAWGGPTYTELITKAILSAPEQRLTLSQIYDWLAENVKYFRERSNYNSSQGWKCFEQNRLFWLVVGKWFGDTLKSGCLRNVVNAIRHTLSLRKRFVRVPRVSAANTWYSSWWTVSPELLGEKL